MEGTSGAAERIFFSRRDAGGGPPRRAGGESTVETSAARWLVRNALRWLQPQRGRAARQEVSEADRVGVKLSSRAIAGREARVAHGRKAVPLQGKGPWRVNPRLPAGWTGGPFARVANASVVDLPGRGSSARKGRAARFGARFRRPQSCLRIVSVAEVDERRVAMSARARRARGSGRV